MVTRGDKDLDSPKFQKSRTALGSHPLNCRAVLLTTLTLRSCTVREGTELNTQERQEKLELG